ncbi:hypothetical protein Purlil1_12726 [Purpureocillium lilacinum]|uniref:C2H2-type domain-containing protein n=1 Tax=Purpureocillium lilacinum TaxID=33203 RepID=A0ABR0BG34_PURLI|nr:hypothetical protein Purlil1_12726 [Purpureocillium lilacinum]
MSLTAHREMWDGKRTTIRCDTAGHVQRLWARTEARVREGHRLWTIHAIAAVPRHQAMGGGGAWAQASEASRATMRKRLTYDRREASAARNPVHPVGPSGSTALLNPAEARHPRSRKTFQTHLGTWMRLSSLFIAKHQGAIKAKDFVGFKVPESDLVPSAGAMEARQPSTSRLFPELPTGTPRTPLLHLEPVTTARTLCKMRYRCRGCFEPLRKGGPSSRQLVTHSRCEAETGLLEPAVRGIWARLNHWPLLSQALTPRPGPRGGGGQPHPSHPPATMSSHRYSDRVAESGSCGVEHYLAAEKNPGVERRNHLFLPRRTFHHASNMPSWSHCDPPTQRCPLRDGRTRVSYGAPSGDRSRISGVVRLPVPGQHVAQLLLYAYCLLPTMADTHIAQLQQQQQQQQDQRQQQRGQQQQEQQQHPGQQQDGQQYQGNQQHHNQQQYYHQYPQHQHDFAQPAPTYAGYNMQRWAAPCTVLPSGHPDLCVRLPPGFVFPPPSVVEAEARARETLAPIEAQFQGQKKK